MKTHSKIPVFLTLGALVGALGIAGVATAHPGGRGDHGGRGGFGGRFGIGGFGAQKFLRLMHDLDLTEEQEVTAVRLKRKLRAAREESRAAMQADMKAVMLELRKSEPNSTLIHETIDRAMERRRANAHKAVDAFLELHTTLTPEQQAQLRTRMSEVQERMEERRARKNRRRRPPAAE